MNNILFVCYGNICRSPMAEMIFKDLVYKNNKRYKFSCASRATSFEEIGNPMYPDAIKILESKNVTIERHEAKRLTKSDYDNYDYILVMEESNIKEVMDIIGDDPEGKVRLLLSFTNLLNKNIPDPWYTGDFLEAYNLIYAGCYCLFNKLLEGGEDNEI